jgi:hypothetical protein
MIFSFGIVKLNNIKMGNCSQKIEKDITVDIIPSQNENELNISQKLQKQTNKDEEKIQESKIEPIDPVKSKIMSAFQAEGLILDDRYTYDCLRLFSIVDRIVENNNLSLKEFVQTCREMVEKREEKSCATSMDNENAHIHAAIAGFYKSSATGRQVDRMIVDCASWNLIRKNKADHSGK